jgi:hypothetical protein
MREPSIFASAPNAAVRCTPEAIGTFDEGTPADVRARLTEYFAAFCAPIVTERANLFTGARCLCGGPLTGMFGTFTYGLAHGEGFCGTCGHPGRADHYITDAQGGDLLCLRRFPLLYHPDALTPASEAAP